MDTTVKEKPIRLGELQDHARELANRGIVSEGVCPTTADTAAKTVTLGTTFKFESGATFLVKFTNAVSVANSTLAVTHTDPDGVTTTETAKPIYYRGAALPSGKISAGDNIILRYDGTSYNVIGTLAQDFTETDPVFTASPAHKITDGDIANWNNKTSNIGTITGITMNGSSKGTSGVVDLGIVITSHQDISGKADKSQAVSGVNYDTTNKKITKTVNGTTTDVVSASSIVTDGGGLKSHQSVTDHNPTLSWGNKSKVATVGSTEINVTMPQNPNIDTTYKLTIGSTTKGDTANGVDLGTLKSESASSGGSTLSLVTTGEKHVWNAKQEAITFNTAYDATTNKAATMADIPTIEDFHEAVATLSAAPTSSTLTYTRDGVAYEYKIGDQVRVHDTEKGTAEGNYYVFYTLKDKSNNTAYWEESGSGGGVAQKSYSVLIYSNQTDKTDIASARVTYNHVDYASEATINVPTSTTITAADLSASSVSNYTPTIQVTGLIILVTYNAELLTVNITADEVPSSVSSCSVTVKDSNNTILGTLSNGQSLKIPYGTIYTCTPSASPNNDYKKPADVTKDWSDSVAKSLTFTYECMYVDFGLPSGVKWAKCNIGASVPEEEGLYFDWGNVDGHTIGDGYDFNQTHYKTTTGGTLAYTAVLHGSNAMFSSGSTTYDAARVNMGGSWRIPSYTELEELKDNCTLTIETVNNVQCVKISRNNKYIHIPFGGRIEGTSWVDRSNIGFTMMSNEVMMPANYIASFKALMLKPNATFDIELAYSTHFGYLIRPVR